MATSPCPSCGEPMAIGGKKKPYLACKACGVQTMVRGKVGVDKFEAKHGKDWRTGGAGAGSPKSSTSPNPKEPDRAQASPPKTLDEEFTS